MGDLMTAVAPSATPHPAGRAVEPRAQGYLDRDGVRIFYELFGDAPETILFLPPWAINHSRFSGATGAKPTPQLPSTSVVTPCQLVGDSVGSHVT